MTIDQIYAGGTWSGSLTQMINRFNAGKYCVKIFDADSGKLLYSRGFDSYFGEYQTSGPAARGVKRAFHETALIPHPKRPVRFVLQKRDRANELQDIFGARIDPTVKIFESHTG